MSHFLSQITSPASKSICEVKEPHVELESSAWLPQPGHFLSMGTVGGTQGDLQLGLCSKEEVQGVLRRTDEQVPGMLRTVSLRAVLV